MFVCCSNLNGQPVLGFAFAVTVLAKSGNCIEGPGSWMDLLLPSLLLLLVQQSVHNPVPQSQLHEAQTEKDS